MIPPQSLLHRAFFMALLLSSCASGRGKDLCVGPTPESAAWSASPSPSWDGSPVSGTPLVGESAPSFALPDLQPKSCGYQATYGLELFTGSPFLVAVLAGW